MSKTLRASNIICFNNCNAIFVIKIGCFITYGNLETYKWKCQKTNFFSGGTFLAMFPTEGESNKRCRALPPSWFWEEKGDFHKNKKFPFGQFWFINAEDYRQHKKVKHFSGWFSFSSTQCPRQGKFTKYICRWLDSRTKSRRHVDTSATSSHDIINISG